MLKVTIASAVCLIALIGCQAPGPAPSATPQAAPQEVAKPAPPVPVPVPPPPPPAPTPTAAELALSDGIALYDAGDFNGAIQRLQGAKEIWDASQPRDSKVTTTRLAAHKYLAFSYCVTSRRNQCRQQFVDAIRLDPSFDLEPAEKTHPIWGPEFERARKQAATPAVPAKPVKPAGATPTPPSAPQKSK
jgi:hypothetical protein